MTDNGQHPVAAFVRPQVRTSYRQTMTGADKFALSFLTLTTDGQQSYVQARELARFCLESFVGPVELLQAGGSWSDPKPFSWALIEGLTAEQMDGWPQELAFLILRDVVNKNAQTEEALKKTSQVSSAPISSDAKPEDPRSPT